MLLKQGLLGSYRFYGKEGAVQYVRQAGCIQYDPVDVCGKNAELTLQSGRKGFHVIAAEYKTGRWWIILIKKSPFFQRRTGRIFQGTASGASAMGSVLTDFRNWKRKQLNISQNTVRSAVQPFRSRGRSSGILPCTGVETGIRSLRRVLCWSSCIRTEPW